MSDKPVVIKIRSGGETYEVPLSLLADLPNLVNQVELLTKRVTELEQLKVSKDV